MQSTQLICGVYRRCPVAFLRHILPHKDSGRAKLRCQLAAFRLEHVANDNPGAFRDEQARLGCTLPACSPTDEYCLPFETIHFEAPFGLPRMRTTLHLRRPPRLLILIHPGMSLELTSLVEQIDIAAQARHAALPPPSSPTAGTAANA